MKKDNSCEGSHSLLLNFPIKVFQLVMDSGTLQTLLVCLPGLILKFGFQSTFIKLCLPYEP